MPSACSDCHEDDRPENHNEGQDCGLCHTPFGWGDIVVDHGFFPLAASHAPECERCHVDGTYEGLDPACASCHEPDRPAGHFVGQDCGKCHEPTSWSDAAVDHGFFPLTAAHDLACESCHVNGTFEGLDATCVSCHEADRPAGHFPGQECGKCHEPTSWGDAEFDHDFLPLTNAHDLDCESCHTNGTFEGLDATCTSCHDDDRPPNHFPGRACDECHEPTRWEDADYDHTFDVPHNGVGDCVDCHLIAPDYSQPSCTHCHEHVRDEMDDEHDDVRDYEFDNAACVDCHPDGEED